MEIIKGLSRIYVCEMPPIDYWDYSISVGEMYKEEDEIIAKVKQIIKEVSGEEPHTIRCGAVANPDDWCFHPIIYAKISNNGTTYALTDVDLSSISTDIYMGIEYLE